MGDPPSGGASARRIRRGPTLLLLLILGLGTAACAAGPGPAARPVPDGSLFVAGYHPWWAGAEPGAYPMEILDALYFFEVEAGADGRISDRRGWSEDWAALRERASRAGVQVIPTLTMHEPGAFESVFGDPAATARLVDATLRLVTADPRVRGIHLDIEVFRPVDSSARDGYTAFAASLARRLREADPGLGLSVFLPAFDDGDAYNERALAGLADYVVVQGYDFHHRGEDTSGPVAPLRGWGRLNWEVVLARFMALGVPRHRMIMALPLYGYQWPTESEIPGSPTRGEGVAIPLAAPPAVLPQAPRARQQADLHGLRRDLESGSPWYAARDSVGGWVQGWFDDEVSLADKVAFVRARGIGGIAFFPLTYGDARLWESLGPLLDRR